MTDHIFDEDESKAKTAKDHPQQLSDLLRNLALHTGARISIREIANALADRSFGAFLVIFAIPNLIGNRTVERLLGLFALIVAIVCALPIPLGNWLPAFALAVIGFAHTERDGLGLGIGIAIGVISVAVAGFVVLTAGALLFLVF